jgi:hypothetical protein
MGRFGEDTMNRLRKKGILGVLSGSIVFLPSCTNAMLQAVRDAAIAGTAGFVEQTTFDLLDVILGSDDSAEAGTGDTGS